MKTPLFFFLNLLLLASPANATDWIQLSQDNLAHLLKLQKAPMVRTDIRTYSTEKLTYITTGVPKSAKVMNTNHKTYRHYVGSGLDKILACNCLKAGITPYIILQPGLGKEIFDDLYGIFFTSTTAKPEEVGLNSTADYDYIDFELRPDTGAIWLESNIFLVPGRGDIPEWLKPKYLEYQRTGICEKSLCSSFKRIDRHGGIDPMFIPVDIKCVKQNKIVKCL